MSDDRLVKKIYSSMVEGISKKRHTAKEMDRCNTARGVSDQDVKKSFLIRFSGGILCVQVGV